MIEQLCDREQQQRLNVNAMSEGEGRRREVKFSEQTKGDKGANPLLRQLLRTFLRIIFEGACPLKRRSESPARRKIFLILHSLAFEMIDGGT